MAVGHITSGLLPAWHESSWDPLGEMGMRLGLSREGKQRPTAGEMVAREEPWQRGLRGARLSRGDGAEGRGRSGWDGGRERVAAPASAQGHQKRPSAPRLEKQRVLSTAPQPTSGEDPQDRGTVPRNGTAFTNARLWRRQRGFGVLFNPFLQIGRASCRERV